MPQLDVSIFLSQLFWLLISFGLLYFLLDRICIPRLEKIFTKREAEISNCLAAAHQAKEEAEKLKKDYENAITRAAQVKNEMIAETIKKITQMSDIKLAEVSLELKQMYANSEENLKKLKANTQADVLQIAKEASFYILKDLANIEVTESEVCQAVEEATKEGSYGI